MNTKIFPFIVLFFAVNFFSLTAALAQNKPIEDMTRQEVLAMDYDQLIEMPLDDLMKLAEIVGVSLDELYEMVLNKDLSIASKYNESTFDSPLSTSVITAQEIRQSGATCIAEVFRLIPGFIVRQKTPGNFDVHIRGNDNVPPGNLMLYTENTTTLVLIDGRVVYNYVMGGTFWESIPIDILDIERIEVVRGPASALYGPNAVSGVINIITKNPQQKELKFDADVQMGNLNTKIASAGASFSASQKLRFRISGNYQYLERPHDEMYMWPLHAQYPESDGYFHRDSIGATNIFTGKPIKPDTTPQVYFPDPNIAKNLYGANAFIFYDPNEDLSFTLSAGLQNSEVISSMIDDSYISYARRLVESKYADLRTKAYGFDAHFSYQDGYLNASSGSKGLQFDYNNLNIGLEYAFTKVKNLTIRPGISYERASYDDSQYLTDQNLLNGEETMNYLALSLRADYMLFDRWRMIAALRQDNYNNPKDPYFSFQFVSSFEINENNIIRAVYSRANNSPFISNTYTNFTWRKFSPEELPPYGMNIRFDGNKQLELPHMDLYEVGYKSRLFKAVLLNIELFHSRMTNIAAFMPDTVNLLQNPPGSIYFYTDPQTGQPTPIPYDIHVSYENWDVVSKLFGVTAEISMALSEKFRLRAFGTYQQTHLENLYPYNIDETVGAMTESIVTQYLTQGTIGTGTRPDTLTETDNEATPQFYGGLALNYQPFPKFNLNTSVYYYSKQKLMVKHGDFDIDPKFIWNLKISYKLWKENAIYFNARNLLNNNSQEFGFLDKMGGQYLFGLRISF